MSIFTANKTGARLLVDYALEKWGPQTSNENPQNEKRFLMIYDLYIKARSYAIINKVAFWLGIIAGIMVLVWPSLSIITKDFGFDKEFLKSAIVQTSMTGFAALIFAVYSHYKKRQMYVENLMRYVIYSDQSNQALLERVLKEMARIDTGFSFTDTTEKKDAEKD